MSDAREWLAARSGPVPPALEARMESAIDAVAPGSDGGALSFELAAAAQLCMRDALASADDRSAALHLLAADGLMTYACEAAAEAVSKSAGDTAGTDAASDIAALADAFAPERLAHLVDAEAL